MALENGIMYEGLYSHNKVDNFVLANFSFSSNFSGSVSYKIYIASFVKLCPSFSKFLIV